MNDRDLRLMLLRGASAGLLAVDDGGEGDGAGGGDLPAPSPEAGNPLADGAGDPAPAGEAGDPPPPAPSEEPAPAAAPKPDRVPWQQKRIDQLTAEKKSEAERAARAAAEADDLRRRLAAYEAAGLPAGSAPPAPTAPASPTTRDLNPDTGRVYTQAEVQAEAGRIAHAQRLNDKLNSVFEQGLSAHGDAFKEQIVKATNAFGAENLTTRVDFFEALADLPNAADVYHRLTGDLDHFSEVLAMNPVQLGRELERLSNAKPKAPVVSRVPAPIEPIEGAGGKDKDRTEMSPEEYDAIRQRERAERRQQRGY